MSLRITRAVQGLAVLFASLTGAVGCSFVGRDAAKRPRLCVIVAPVGLRPTELRASVTAVVQRAAAEHATITVIVAAGPSAAAFDRVTFSKEANGGVFASKAANPAARNHDARRWAKAALREIMADLPPAALSDGLDLIGGLEQCADGLATERRHPTVVVVSTGLHRTSDLDLADGETETPAKVISAVVRAVREPLSLQLREIGSFDPSATKGPIARAVAEGVRSAWTAACDALHPRCTIDTLGGHP